jgi:Dyp-type peroxidase family
MAVVLDLADIQGNILAGYGKQGFPKGRYILLHIDGADEAQKAANGRAFVNEWWPRVTNALRWEDKPHKPGDYVVPKPRVAVNIAFTFRGLVALGVPTRTLRGLPDPFIDGMAARARLLGDDFAGANWRNSWDEVWQADAPPAHVLVTLNAQADAIPELEEITNELEASAKRHSVLVIEGHNQRGKPKERYQAVSALWKADGSGPAPIEHFGLADGISDPVFDGQYPDDAEKLDATGNGAVDGQGNWRPLATGEFLLGYPDEAQEIAGAAMPIPFSRNGTFVAYRKLHENVKSWRDFMTKAAKDFGKVFKIPNDDDARELLIAKIVGRWSNGVPLSKAPTPEEWHEVTARLRELPRNERNRIMTSFTFLDDDAEGVRCPLGSHIRRVNTRDGLDPRAVEAIELRGGSTLNNRRRILRRGLPYGSSGQGTRDEDDHGIVMLVMCADLFRQFEFVQQQWVNYGLDARSGSDTCPIVGNHSQGLATRDPDARKRNGPKAKFVIAADPTRGHPPFILEGLPQFIEMRGGEYFFAPSVTALRMISLGCIDPT